jgi:hypothetical protein
MRKKGGGVTINPNDIVSQLSWNALRQHVSCITRIISFQDMEDFFYPFLKTFWDYLEVYGLICFSGREITPVVSGVLHRRPCGDVWRLASSNAVLLYLSEFCLAVSGICSWIKKRRDISRV